jgi:hypothetical protein
MVGLPMSISSRVLNVARSLPQARKRALAATPDGLESARS